MSLTSHVIAVAVLCHPAIQVCSTYSPVQNCYHLFKHSHVWASSLETLQTMLQRAVLCFCILLLLEAYLQDEILEVGLLGRKVNKCRDTFVRSCHSPRELYTFACPSAIYSSVCLPLACPTECVGRLLESL